MCRRLRPNDAQPWRRLRHMECAYYIDCGSAAPATLHREDALSVEMEQRGGAAQVGWMFSNRLNCPATMLRLRRQKSGWVMSAPNRAARGAA